jgi:hypothetical protein
MRLAIFCLFALVPVPAFAEVITLGGKLGGRDIVVELTQPSDGAVAGRFAFLDTGGDVPLVAVSDNGKSWVLNEEAPCGEDDCTLDDSGQVIQAPIAAVWELTYDPKTYMATGTRRAEGSKNKAQPLELGVIAWRTLDESEEATAFGLHDRSAALSYMNDWPIDWSGAPYEMMLMDVPLNQGPEQILEGATYNYVTDPRTKFAFPRAIAFADGSSVSAVNAIFADRHARMNLSAFDCLALRFASYGADSEWGIRGGFLGDMDNEQVEVTYLSPLLVSWTQSGSLWCTGAHPYNHFDSYTFDIATGERLDAQAFMADWVPREWNAAPDALADTDLAFENPDAYQWGPGPDLIAFVRERIPQEVMMGDAETDETCYGDQAIAEHLDIRLAAGPSLVFTVNGYPHAVSVCTTDLFTLPLEEVKDMLKPEALAYFPGLSN